MPDNTAQLFQHNKLRTLNLNQRISFQADLEKIIKHFKPNVSGITHDKIKERYLPNYIIKEEMVKLLNHLNEISEIIEKLQPSFWQIYLKWKESDKDRNTIARFPNMIEVMKEIVADSVGNETYKMSKLAPDQLIFITMQAKQLLEKYGIKQTDTKRSAWYELIKYIFRQVYERDVSDTRVANYVKRFIG